MMNRPSFGSSGRTSLLPQRVKRDSSGVSKSGRPSTSNGRFSGGSRQSLAIGARQSISTPKNRLSFNTPGQGGKKPLGLANSSSKVQRVSTAGKSYNHGSKDPRPIGEKGYREKCVRQLVEFLTANGYSQPISMKILQSPRSKDFTCIFQFLMSMIEPAYKLGTKIEDEIPTTLRILGYPFSISKSMMYAIGAPHSWPALLGALMWMVDVIQSAMRTASEELIFPMCEDSFDSVPESKIVFSYCEKSFKSFLTGLDEFDDLEEQLARDIKQNGAAGEIENLNSRNKRLKEELQMLQEEPNKLQQLQSMIESLQIDNRKFASFREDQNTHFCQQNEFLTAEDEQCTILENNRCDLQAALKRKRHTVSTQKFTQSDVQRTKLDRLQRQQEKEKLQKEIDDLNKHIWENEINFSRIHEKISAKVTSYDNTAQMLRLIPPTAENAFGIDYEMKATFVSHETDKYRNVIKPALTQIVQESIKRESEVVEEKLNLQEKLDQLREVAQEKEEACEKLAAATRKADEELDVQKQALSLEYQQKQQALEASQKELAMLRKNTVDTRELYKQLEQERTRVDQQTLAQRLEREKYCDFLSKAVDIVIKHKEAIQKGANEVKEKLVHQLEANVN